MAEKRSLKLVSLLKSATTTGASAWGALPAEEATIQATITGTGALTSTVNIEFSNDMIAPLTGFTLSLAGDDLVSVGDKHTGKWAYVRANVTEISGTSASITVTMGL